MNAPAAEDHSSLQIEVAGADLLPTVSVISNSRELLSTDATKSRYAYPRFRIEKSDSADRYGSQHRRPEALPRVEWI